MALTQIDTPPGEARDARFVEAMEQCAEVYTASALETLQSLMVTAPAAQQPALQRLRAWGLTMHVQNALWPTQRQIRARQRTTTCLVDEEPIPLLASFSAMAAEKRRDRRAAIEAAVVEQLDTLNALFEEQFEELCRVAARLGYASPEPLWADILPVEPAAQQDLVTRVLEGTHEVYVDLLSWAVKQRFGIPLGQLKRHDILALFTFTEYQQYYQPGEVVPSLRAGLRDMGIDPYADGRLVWRERPAHFGPPAALAVHIPDEIVLSYGPVGGLKGAEACASACGRALLWAYTAPELPAVARLLGDPAIPDSNAQLLAEMIAQPRWLRHYAEVSVDGNYGLWRRLDRLYRLRRHLGRFLYTRHLYTTNSLAGAAEAYRDLMMEACHVDYPLAYYLLDWDWQYTTLTAWRGWSLAYALLEALRTQLAEDWFRHPDSGEWLRHYWEDALGRSVDDLQQRLMGAAWDVNGFIDTLVSL
jgi:hypothetical protein